MLNGYEQPATLSALLWSQWHRKPVILLSATKEDDVPRFWWRETVKHWILKGYKISSYAAYRQAAGSNAWDLVLCGDGELRPQIEQQIAKLDLQNSVHLPGFLQQDKLLPYFAYAKCFIHASIQKH